MTTTNFSKYLVGAGILALTATSCSNEIDINPDVNPADGRKAYMTISLHDVNRGTRADGEEFDDSNYLDGDEAEYTINNARFFFFDEQGMYICESSVWNGHDMVGTDKDNFTLEGKTVVVLENLTSKANPTYMLTVLNGDGFEPSATLQATAESLCQYKNNGQFVMSTSSYFDGSDANHDDTYYYATKLTYDNFAEGTPTTDAEAAGLKPVDVYIERLAGKAELKYDKLGNEKKTVDGRVLYKVNATVSGNPNIEGGIDEGVTQLYIEILGWSLNGTAPDSYLSKQFAPEFSVAGNNPWKNWNNAGDHRSFWAKTLGYGDDQYELNYVTYSGIHNTTPDPDVYTTLVRYANEYAPVPSIYNKDGQIVPSKLTHVILKTRICDEDGGALDLVRGANGVLYHKTSYLKYILNNANIQKKLNLWYLTDKSDFEEVGRETLPNGDQKITYTATTKFSQMDERMVKLEATKTGTGMVKVVSNVVELKDANGGEFIWAVKNDDGTFSTVTEAEADALLTASLQGVTGNSDKGAMAYTGGASYYVIPIEHNSYVGKTALDNDGGFNYNLGYHGFIRNHWYQITLNKIEKIGYGVFDPGTGEGTDDGEKIIPTDPENPAFFVTANLKVLAWKIVNQSVDL